MEESELDSNISDFVDHRKTDKALTEDDAYTTVKGRKVQKRTVKGWLLCAEVDLKIAKDARERRKRFYLR